MFGTGIPSDKSQIALNEILGSDQPDEMKRIGGRIVTTEKWDEIKMEVMEELVFCKFRQNRTLFHGS